MDKVHTILFSIVILLGFANKQKWKTNRGSKMKIRN